MTFEEYDKFKREFDYINRRISYNFGLLESRWLDRKMNKEDISYNKDMENLNNIYKGYLEMQKIVKQYIE